MAEASPTTPHAAPKGATAFTHTTTSRRFSELLGTLAQAIVAERDIAHIWSHDPAFRDWRDESELLWQRAAEEAAAVFDGPVLRPADRVLIRAARILHYALGCERPAEYDAAVADLAACSESLALRRENAVTGRTYQLLRMAEARLAEIGDLEMIPTASDPDLQDGLDDWPPIAC
ncbi:hypothetical protein SAMN04489859_10587 [Paracoccus alcaliphilus]|uniref:Uncharacterized protein n=1 Tax=Paracoccus alcaliphilus TaxID=34002 RepID=A0A1H8NEH4_9RHOB|nr:hypothetical protein [Paracoccus alcaliphilus]WCR18759.1 hypothetical protein JHW40_03310 [Paracoccus alcaliphilus]SEO27932.1 hypothetical protein SAMN04489859_10587 [Paracoccus alcaliphilus]